MSIPLLRCENIHKTYILGRTVLPVLRGVSLDIAAGDFVSIMGSSGSGKSTLLHVLSGLDVPEKGQTQFRDEVLYEPEGSRRIPVGRDADPIVVAQVAASGKSDGNSKGRAATATPPRFRESVRNRLRNTAFGFVFQFYHLLPEFNVLENVLLPQMVGRSMGHWLEGRVPETNRALELLHRMGLKDRLRHRPTELSGGERQRVAIARALMNRPEVLFADEPTGNLDGRTGRDILALLKELNQSGQTVVMVTHDRELGQMAGRVIHLVDGRIS